MAERLVAGIASVVAHCYDSGESRETLRIMCSPSFFDSDTVSVNTDHLAESLREINPELH
jgi:hypothetical protein